jgi:hypothetical protein
MHAITPQYITYYRYDPDQKALVLRTLRISLVCSGKQETAEGLAMWKQDIVVATAGKKVVANYCALNKC